MTKLAIDGLRSEHTLPVTALYCGVGLADPLVASVSLDRSCKVYSLAQGVKSKSMVALRPLPRKHRAIAVGLERELDVHTACSACRYPCRKGTFHSRVAIDAAVHVHCY